MKEQIDKEIRVERGEENYSTLKHLLFTYKTRNSLVENIDMPSRL